MHAIKTQRNFRKNEKAASPAVSTIIIIAATTVMILVAMSYANGFLTKRVAENEYSANKQFMLTTGLQIDDTAWSVSRTQTISYTSNYGSMHFQPLALNYTFEVNKDGVWEHITANETGMIIFNMPVTMYTMGNGYFERLSSGNNSFIQTGASASVADVYCIEKLPMPDGSYTRIIVVPTVRMLNSSITTTSGTTNYYKLYLPTLNRAYSNLYLSQSVSLTGAGIQKIVVNDVDQIRINITFPNGEPYTTNKFDSDFFGFEETVDFYHASKTIDVIDNSVIELYIGKITVGIGQV